MFAILVEGPMRHISVILSYILYQWIRRNVIYAILKEGIMRNIHVRLYEIWISGSGREVV